MASTDKVEAGRMRFGMKQETFVCRISFEVNDAVTVVELAVYDVVSPKALREDLEEVAVLREDDGFGSWIDFAEVENVAD